MSALFAALFGTPLTAAFFALEVISVGVFTLAGLVPCVASAMCAYWFGRALGVEPTGFVLEQMMKLSPANGLRVVVLSAIVALFSIFYCWFMKESHHQLDRIKNPYIRAFAGGAIIVILTLLLGRTDYNGAGMPAIILAIGGQARVTDFFWKMLFTAITIGAGFKGGEIVPTFFIGASLGCVLGPVLGMDPGFAAAVGLVALFCSVVNCPIASIFLALELFGFVDIRLFAISAAVCYMLSGYSGLYSGQRVVYSKLRIQLLKPEADEEEEMAAQS
jgi:H+/Cl- antiporter ClcA